MLAIDSELAHPRFDLAKAQPLFQDSEALQQGELITSPYDLYIVESLRTKHKLRKGEKVDADVFVFGKGEPARRDCTKVGGLPYWPASRPWPLDSQGRPFQFLAQFNFSDSRDLAGPLPADLLLIFVEPDSQWQYDPTKFHFEWVSSGEVPGLAFDPTLIAFSGGPFWGAIYRTADFPDAFAKADKLKVRKSYLLPILHGTKIGGLPVNQPPSDESFLCQLGSIQAAPNCPFPWVNQSEELTFGKDESGIHGETNCLIWGDMGTACVFLDRTGKLRICMDSH